MPKLDDMPIGSLSVAQAAEYLDDRPDVECVMVLWVQRDGDDKVCVAFVGDSHEPDYAGHEQLLGMAQELVAEFKAEALDDEKET